MHKIKRALFKNALRRLENNPALALLGPRQVGKSTLALDIVQHYPKSLYLDLERPDERQKVLSDPERFFELHKDKLICLDEIQRLPEVFTYLRSRIDRSKRNAQLLILGSASRDLIQQSSETLAGRISYLEISPFTFEELTPIQSIYERWIKGGYPRAYLATNDLTSYEWREDYIQTFLERDLPQLGFSIPSTRLYRLWQMLAHSHGQLLNKQKLAASLGVTNNTVNNYIDILEQTFLIRRLNPYHTNLKKRLIKSPKIYIRDSGLLHTLLRLESIDDLLGHPVIGTSFEGLVIENLLPLFPRYAASFYRDSNGNELDLILEKGNERIAIEIKATTTPTLEKGFWNSLKVVKPTKTFVVCQCNEPFPGKDGIQFTNLLDMVHRFK